MKQTKRQRSSIQQYTTNILSAEIRLIMEVENKKWLQLFLYVFSGNQRGPAIFTASQEREGIYQGCPILEDLISGPEGIKLIRYYYLHTKEQAWEIKTNAKDMPATIQNNLEKSYCTLSDPVMKITPVSKKNIICSVKLITQ